MMYGVTPRAKIEMTRKLPPEKDSSTQQRPAHVLPDLIETFSVNAGGRDVRAQAIDRQQAQSEKDPLAQIRHTDILRTAARNFSIRKTYFELCA